MSPWICCLCFCYNYKTLLSTEDSLRNGVNKFRFDVIKLTKYLENSLFL